MNSSLLACTDSCRCGQCEIASAVRTGNPAAETGGVVATPPHALCSRHHASVCPGSCASVRRCRRYSLVPRERLQIRIRSTHLARCSRLRTDLGHRRRTPRALPRAAGEVAPTIDGGFVAICGRKETHVGKPPLRVRPSRPTPPRITMHSAARPSPASNQIASAREPCLHTSRYAFVGNEHGGHHFRG
jgi:hypothetical protein